MGAHRRAPVRCHDAGSDGGAMISASGWLAMLLWASEWAYPIGAVGTLLTAWMVGRRGLRALGLDQRTADGGACGRAAGRAHGRKRGLCRTAFTRAGIPFPGSGSRRCLCGHEPCTGHWGSMPLRTGNGAPDGVSVLGTGRDVGHAAYAQRQRIPAAAGPAGRGVPHRAGCWRSLDGPAFSSVRGCCFWRCLRRWAAVLCALDGAGAGVRPIPACRIDPGTARWRYRWWALKALWMAFTLPPGLACLVLVFGPLLWARRKLPLDNPLPIQYDRKKRTNDCTRERRTL